MSTHVKFGLWDYTLFVIGITGLQDPPYGGPNIILGLFYGMMKKSFQICTALTLK